MSKEELKEMLFELFKSGEIKIVVNIAPRPTSSNWEDGSTTAVWIKNEWIPLADGNVELLAKKSYYP